MILISEVLVLKEQRNDGKSEQNGEWRLLSLLLIVTTLSFLPIATKPRMMKSTSAFLIFVVMMIAITNKVAAYTARPVLRNSQMVRHFWPFDKEVSPTGVVIIDAIQTQSEDSVKSVMAATSFSKTMINDREPETGNNAMHIIAKRGHYKYPPAQIPKMLVDGGIDIDARNAKGETPLEISLLSGWQVIRFTVMI